MAFGGANKDGLCLPATAYLKAFLQGPAEMKSQTDRYALCMYKDMDVHEGPSVGVDDISREVRAKVHLPFSRSISGHPRFTPTDRMGKHLKKGRMDHV
jgi:hypothetical protein